MKNSNIILILLVVAGLVGAIFLLSNNNGALPSVDNKTSQSENSEQLTSPQDETTQPVGNDLMENGEEEESPQPPQDAYAPTAGVYSDYDPALLANADMGDVVLFFKAGWCPTCNALDNDINANLDQLPEDVTVLEVDYDNSQELKEKYGVKVQHTLVQVDSDGNEIKQWQGSLKLEQLLSEIV